MSDAQEILKAAARIERAVDEAYSRYAGAAEAERIEGMALALHDALGGEPASLQPALLDILAQRYQRDEPYEPVVTTAKDPAAMAEAAALRLEVEQLRREKQAPRVDLLEAPPAILETLLGGDAKRMADHELPDGARVASVVQELMRFTVDLGRAFLGTSTKKGDTARQVDRIRATLRGELSGSLPAGSLAALLDEIKRKVGAQLEAFTAACKDGAQQILKELDPLVLEDQASEAGVHIAGRRPFRYREAWEVFQKRHEELAVSEDLYQTYFDGPLRRALFRLQEPRK